MSYKCISKETVRPAANYIDNNWVRAPDANFLQKQVIARGGNLCLAPASLITAAVDTIMGLGAMLASVITLGLHRPTLKFTGNHITQSENLLLNPYRHLMKTINPEIQFAKDKEAWDPLNPPLITAEGNGFFANVCVPIFNSVKEYSKFDDFYTRHITIRLTSAVLAMAAIITRIADAIICLPAAALSLITLGSFESLNNLASRSLSAPAIIRDLVYCTIVFVNPNTVE